MTGVELADPILQERGLIRSILGSLESHLVVLDRSGEIIAVNDAWREFAAGNDAGVHRLKATDTSTEAVFDYLMERAARPD